MKVGYMKLKKLFKTVLFISIPAFVVSLMSATISWLSTNNEKNLNMSGVVHGSYFQSGDGSEQTPFEIHTPLQLYYFSWLQGLGYFNEPDSTNPSTIKQYHFYLSDNLNMENTILPPIGTTDYPFVGSFTSGDPVITNGVLTGYTPRVGTDAYTISNLKVSNNVATYNDAPSEINGSEIIGFFGVIGSQTIAVTDSMTTNTTNAKVNDAPAAGYTYNTTANYIENFYIDGCTFETQTTEALIGIVAGYVNGPITNVGVSNSNIYVKEGSNPLTDFKNISNYSIVGYATNTFVQDVQNDPEYKTISTNSGTEKVPVADAGSGWGGSIDMLSVFNRCKNVYNSNKVTNWANTTYVTSTTTYYDSSMNVIGEPVEATKSLNNYPFSSNTKVSSSRFYNSNSANGSYAFNYKGSDSQSGQGFCLGGMCNDEMYQEISVIQTDNFLDGYSIKSSSDWYLTINGNSSTIQSTKSSASASAWNITANRIYTQDPDSGIIYYLNNNGENLTLTTTATTSWTINSINESTKEFSCRINNNDFYLIEDNGTWKLSRIDGFYITDGVNYLAANSTTAVKNVKTIGEASIFYMSDNNIYTIYNNANRYLYFDSNNESNPVALYQTNTRNQNRYHFNWTVSEDSIYYDATHYVIFKNGAWTCGASSQNITKTYLSSDGRYLCVNATLNGFSYTTIQDDATNWTINDQNIFYEENGTLYYITHSNNTLGLSTSNTDASWTIGNTNGSGTITYRGGFLSLTTYYLTPSNTGNWSVSRTSSNITTSQVTNTEIMRLGHRVDLLLNYQHTIAANSYREIRREIVETPGGFPSYIPINAVENGNFDVKGGNTGYIISGSNETTQSYRSDIRITHWNKSYLGNGLDGSNQVSDAGVLTYDDSGSHTIDTNAFSKYDLSKENYQEMLDKDNTFVYGLHFMNSEISKNRTFRAPEVVINNSKLYDYELPIDCIDFKLQNQGYINFFGGSYFTDNNCFFSLHEIFRNGNDIDDIKEIEFIYGTDDVTDPFCYKYKNDNNYYIKKVSKGTTLPSGYSVIFKTSWITNPSLTMNQMYYYEIPANAGEYALGSVAGRTGAYLNYLDIAANKQMVDRTYETEQVVETVDTYTYVKGVSFVEQAGDTVDPTNSATYSLGGTYSSSTSGGTNYSRTGDTISVTPDTGVNLEFVGTGITSIPGESHPSKRQYTNTTSIVNQDTNEAAGCDFYTEVMFIDKVTEINGVKGEIDRTILVNHYRVPIGGTFNPGGSDGQEILIMSYKIESFDGINNAFNYSYYIESNLLGLSLQFKQTTNVSITYLASSPYSFNLNGTDLSGSPTDDNPIVRSITAWTDPFNSILDYTTPSD